MRAVISHVQRWAKEVGERPAVKRGRIVNRTNGPLNEQLHERHDASDFRDGIRKISVRGKGGVRRSKPSRPDKAFTPHPAIVHNA
ncbi:hypothetical protein LAD67_08065 [Escherichia coli]|nr:hypothetical protein [Escherichia coli]